MHFSAMLGLSNQRHISACIYCVYICRTFIQYRSSLSQPFDSPTHLRHLPFLCHSATFPVPSMFIFKEKRSRALWLGKSEWNSCALGCFIIGVLWHSALKTAFYVPAVKSCLAVFMIALAHLFPRVTDWNLKGLLFLSFPDWLVCCLFLLNSFSLNFFRVWLWSEFCLKTGDLCVFWPNHVCMEIYGSSHFVFSDWPLQMSSDWMMWICHSNSIVLFIFFVC